MPVSGSTLGTVTIAPCSTFFIHAHPRSDELSHVTAGPLTVGFMFENNTFTEYVVETNQFFVAPAGIFHYQQNNGCNTAQFQISFPEPNPGTLPATFAMATIPAAQQETFFGSTYTMEQAAAVGPFPENAACVAACRKLPSFKEA